MNNTLVRVQLLAKRGDVQISAHGYDELTADDIFFADVMAGLAAAVVVEDYPEFAKGPSVLVLQRDREGRPIHL
jgi:hypothetical protein